MGNKNSNTASYWSQPNPYAARLQHQAVQTLQQYNSNSNDNSRNTGATRQTYRGSGVVGSSNNDNTSTSQQQQSSQQYTFPTSNASGFRLSSAAQSDVQPIIEQHHNSNTSTTISNGVITTQHQRSSTSTSNTNNERLKYLDDKFKKQNKYRKDHKYKMQKRWREYNNIVNSTGHINDTNNTIHADRSNHIANRANQNCSYVGTNNNNHNTNNNNNYNNYSSDDYNPFDDNSINHNNEMIDKLYKHVNDANNYSLQTIELLISILNNLHSSLLLQQTNNNYNNTLHTRSSSISANASDLNDKRRIKLNNNTVQTYLVTEPNAISTLSTVGFETIDMPSNIHYGSIEPYLYYDINKHNINETIAMCELLVEQLLSLRTDKQAQQSQYEQQFNPFPS